MLHRVVRNKQDILTKKMRPGRFFSFKIVPFTFMKNLKENFSLNNITTVKNTHYSRHFDSSNWRSINFSDCFSHTRLLASSGSDELKRSAGATKYNYCSQPVSMF